MDVGYRGTPSIRFSGSFCTSGNPVGQDTATTPAGLPPVRSLHQRPIPDPPGVPAVFGMVAARSRAGAVLRIPRQLTRQINRAGPPLNLASTDPDLRMARLAVGEQTTLNRMRRFPVIAVRRTTGTLSAVPPPQSTLRLTPPGLIRTVVNQHAAAYQRGGGAPLKFI